jgi:hypothetical protein
VKLDNTEMARHHFELAQRIYETKLGPNHEYTQYAARGLRDCHISPGLQANYAGTSSSCREGQCVHKP